MSAVTIDHPWSALAILVLEPISAHRTSLACLTVFGRLTAFARMTRLPGSEAALLIVRLVGLRPQGRSGQSWVIFLDNVAV